MAFYTQSIPKEVLEKFRQYIEQAQNIILVSHTNPDGDALGSSLGLWHYLNLRGKTTNVIVPNRFPGFLKWLPGLDRIVIYEQDERKCAQLFKEADLVICLDFNAFHRVERLEKYLVGFRKPVLLIDHHLEPDVTFDSSISYTDSSSTSELVFDLIEGLGDKELINLDIAKCLYVGIMTDTGSFSYSCKHSRPFNITGFLVEKGLDVQSVNVLVYSTQSEDRLRLLGHLLSKRMVVMSEYNTAYIWLSLSDQI
ncbi:MAG TPA: DHH family phosphoesterase [Bacteroidales bacterium]|nr:DHH family phosphoesterase [Bacteroidales bacterium]